MARVFEQPCRGLWPARSRPKPDELLSSWVRRLAAAHGLSYAALCQRTWPGRTVWHHDLDLRADRRVIVTVGERTGIDAERVKATTLGSLEGQLFAKVKRSGLVAWVLPASLTWARGADRQERPPPAPG